MTTTSVQSNGDVIEVVLTYLSFQYFNHYFMNSIFHSFNYHFNILPLQNTIMISQESVKVTVAPLLPCTHYTISIKPTAAEGEREQIFTLKKSANKKLALIVYGNIITYWLSIK